MLNQILHYSLETELLYIGNSKHFPNNLFTHIKDFQSFLEKETRGCFIIKNLVSLLVRQFDFLAAMCSLSNLLLYRH